MNRLDRQEAYWDGKAKDKCFNHPLRMAKFRELVPLDGGILDYGCGYGRTCAALQAHGYTDVTGVDISERMIARGKTLHPHLRLRHLAAPPLPFADESFAACTLLAVLNCIPTDEGQRELFDELHRVLRPGGILYLSDYPLQQDARNTARYEQFQAKFGTYGIFETPDTGVFRHHAMPWVHELLARFAILEEENLDVLTMNNNKAVIFQIMARK